MARLKTVDLMFIERLLGMESGYVLNFDNGTFDHFFEHELSVNIYDDKYARFGTSKAKRLRAFIRQEESALVARALEALWDYGIEQPPSLAPNWSAGDFARLSEIVAALKADANKLSTNSVTAFSTDITILELVAAVRRELDADKPQVVLDRLHTYCMAKLAALLGGFGLSVDEKSSLQARVGQYANALRREGRVNEHSANMLTSALSLFESYNSLRNKASLAHSAKLVSKAEGRFVCEVVLSALRFVDELEAERSALSATAAM